MPRLFDNKPLLRNTLISAGAHCFLVLALLVWSVASCVMRRRPREQTTFIDLQIEMPPPPAAAPEAPAPTPEPAPKPKPAPKPEPAPQPIPEPAPDKPKPPPRPKVEVSRQLVKRQPETKPRMAEDQVRRLLEGAIPAPRPSAPAADDAAFAWYLESVRNAMYKAWQQPSALAGQRGLVTHMQIRVRRDGAITSRRMLSSSGNALMDDSVKLAVESVARLDPLPAGFGSDYRDITIDFELTDTP
ncbi:MAG: energy transducer TonB [Kiritimatiellia bacterium]|nr:TonB C-terminal domain-containing protein [Lentisphaerota bacterium]